MKKKIRLWLCLGLILITLLSMVTGTLAWLKRQQDAPARVALSDFEIAGTLYFNNKEYIETQKILVDVGLTPGSENYIGNMKYVVNYSGISPACIRVRVIEQWIDTATDELIPTGYTKYTLGNDMTGIPGNVFDKTDESASPKVYNPYKNAADGEGAGKNELATVGQWVDNRSQDFCYYYSVPVMPEVINVDTASGAIKHGTVTMPLIIQTQSPFDGVDLGNLKLQLLLEVEAVQPNRMREFFGIAELPKP